MDHLSQQGYKTSSQRHSEEPCSWFYKSCFLYTVNTLKTVNERLSLPEDSRLLGRYDTSLYK